MINIAIVINNITLRAGTERAVCNLSNMLSQSGKYKPYIISLNSNSGEAVYKIGNDVKLFHLNLPLYKYKITRLKLYFSMVNIIKDICIKENIEIVIGTSHGINISSFFLKGKIKVVAWEEMNYMAASISSRILRKIIYRYLNAVIVLTISDSKHYLYLKKLFIIPNSVSFEITEYSNLSNKVILAIGRFTYQKGFDLLINAISLIKKFFIGWEIKIIGSGEDKEKLINQINFFKLENIIKLYPPTENIIQEYLNACFFVLSSRFEGFPFVMIEAHSCGLPVISFNCPEGPSEFINHNIDGIIIENGNIKELSKAILNLIKDEEKRKFLGHNAIKNSEKYKPENIYPLWDSLLDNL